MEEQCPYYDHLNGLQRFQFEWCCNRLHCYHEGENGCCAVDKWIHHARYCGVPELDLNLHLWTNLMVPLYASLTVLELDLNGGRLSLPTASQDENLVSLQVLKLTRVRFDSPSRDWISWISDSCKHLKELSLSYFHGIRELDIASSSLESLTIKWDSDDDYCDLDHINVSCQQLQTICLLWSFHSSDGKSLRISAPTIQSFCWIGETLNHYYLDDFMSLESATIALTPPPSSMPPTDYNFEKLLGSISRAKSLLLDSLFLEILLLQDCSFSASLDNLQQLTMKLSSGFKKDHLLLTAIGSFLKRTPNLRTVNMSYHDDDDSFDLDLDMDTLSFEKACWESHNILCLADGLKELTIQTKRGENDAELLKYFLGHAKGLEILRLTYSPLDLSQFAVEEWLPEVKIPSSIKVCFMTI